MPRDELWQGGPWEQPRPGEVPRPRLCLDQPIPKRARRRGKKKLIVFLGIVGLICALTAGAVLLGNGGLPWERPKAPSGPTTLDRTETEAPKVTIPLADTGTGVTVTITPAQGAPISFAEVYEKNVRSIVAVRAMCEDGISEGTGIVLTADGYIITNAHVIEGGVHAWVLLSNDVQYPARLVGYSWAEDLAVLKVESEDLIPAEFGDSFALKVGDEVSALGNPLGYRMSLTNGVISAIDRELEVDDVTMHLLQTNTAINFGNSGGALFNDRGQVIGVTVVKIMTDDGSTEGLGFAIPSERVKYVVDHLIAGEEIRVPALGITVEQSPERKGLNIKEIEPWSKANEAGLQVGDFMLAANGHPTTTNRDLERIKDLQKVGDLLELELLRDGKRITCAVELVDWVKSYNESKEID